MSTRDQPPDLDPQKLFEEAVAMVLGAKRWNGAVVSEYLKANNPPNRLVIVGLAKFLAGDSPKGLHLKMHGQGNALTSFESYREYYDALAINEYFQEHCKPGLSQESVVFDAAEQFGVSEATVRRRLRVHKNIEGTDLDVPVSSLNL